jgi:hypothetical protein
MWRSPGFFPTPQARPPHASARTLLPLPFLFPFLSLAPSLLRELYACGEHATKTPLCRGSAAHMSLWLQCADGGCFVTRVLHCVVRWYDLRSAGCCRSGRRWRLRWVRAWSSWPLLLRAARRPESGRRTSKPDSPRVRGCYWSEWSKRVFGRAALTSSRMKPFFAGVVYIRGRQPCAQAASEEKCGPAWRRGTRSGPFFSLRLIDVTWADAGVEEVCE